MFYIYLFTNSFAAIGQSQNEFNILNFRLGISISEYPNFEKADTLIYTPISYIKSKKYYRLKDRDTLLFLGEPIKQIIGATSDNEELISVSVFLEFNSTILDKLINKFGPWQTGSLGQLESANDADTLDTSKLSYYVWKYEKTTLDVIVTRYQSLRNDLIKSNDIIIISYRKITSG
jgi:hypothetical protein